MRQEKIKLEPNGATLTTYIHNDDELRNGILIFPGGAYRYCAPGEGKPVAQEYYKLGFNSFVLEYSCIEGIFGSPKASEEEVFDSALEDAMNAFYYLQNHNDELAIYKDKISIVGFSAGANLAFSSVVLGGIKPLSLILGYGAFSDDSMKSLGMHEQKLLSKLKEGTCPIFMFGCQADSTVPISESLNLALKCHEKKIPFELHTYITGNHGLSLGTKESGVVNKDYATWLNHSIHFIENIQRNTPYELGDIEDDLNDLNINSRIGALMYHEKAWALIKERLPEVAFKAETDSSIRTVPLQRIWQWGIVKEPSQEEIDKLLKEL